MSATLEQVIEALRHELQQYGEMLAVLETHRDPTSSPQSPAALVSISAVEAQCGAIESAGRARAAAQRQLAWALGRTEDDSFKHLIPLLPAEYRPLVAALVQEIAQLCQRAQERARGTQVRLQRALELMENFISRIAALEPPELPEQEASVFAGDPPPISTANC